MGGYNDGVYKLDEFCALLTQTNDRLIADHSTMENLEQAIEQFEPSIDKTLGALGDAVADFQRRLGEAERSAAEEVEGLAEDARELDSGRLPAVGDQVEAAEDALEGRLQAEGAALDQAFAELASQGFASLDAGLEALQAAGTALAGELEQDFTALTQALQAGGQRIDQAEAETVAELSQAADTFTAEDQAGLDAAAAECLAGWGTELPAALEAQTAEFGQEFVRVYDEFESGAEAGGEGLKAAVAALFQETADYTRGEAGARLEEALDLAVDQALPALAQELGGLLVVLGGCEETGAALDPMVTDLEIAGRVMEQIDRLLQAME
jgi:hypothetical protein